MNTFLILLHNHTTARRAPAADHYGITAVVSSAFLPRLPGSFVWTLPVRSRQAPEPQVTDAGGSSTDPLRIPVANLETRNTGPCVKARRIHACMCTHDDHVLNSGQRLRRLLLSFSPDRARRSTIGHRLLSSDLWFQTGVNSLVQFQQQVDQAPRPSRFLMNFSTPSWQIGPRGLGLVQLSFDRLGPNKCCYSSRVYDYERSAGKKVSSDILYYTYIIDLYVYT